MYPNDTCVTHTPGVPRIGLPSYLWLVEANTVVSSACTSQWCATTFAGPVSMAATWNRTAWRWKGRVMGVEQRAMMNIHTSRFAPGQAERHGIGFTAFGPNMNLQRDPRFGRSSELPGGEDPYLVGQYAAEMVKGLQTTDHQGYPLTLAYLKHFAVYNRETNRGSDNYNISMFDLFDSYLPAFLYAAQFATGVMCSYASVNGQPSCANFHWLRRHLPASIHVTSDCDAIRLLQGPPAHADSGLSAAVWAIRNGTDLEMGSLLYSSTLLHAVEQGFISEVDHVDTALRRGYGPQMRAGRFDPVAPWAELGSKDIGSHAHAKIQLETALQGIVLLQNRNETLPIASHKRVAVLGPMAHTRAGLMSSYESDQTCPGGGHDCVATLAETIAAWHKGPTTNAPGVDVASNRTDGIAPAIAIGREADVIVLCLGITKRQEHEGLDRTSTTLPGLQEQFAFDVLSLGVPVVLVLVHGGQIAIDKLVESTAAILDIFNPNTVGGIAMAMQLTGCENRWGKLPYTVYPESAMDAFDMEDHSMTTPPGRTYRYFTGDAIFPFGYGLSYTKFLTSCKGFSGYETISIECYLQNLGSRPGDEVLQVFHSVGDGIRNRVSHPVPISTLCAFERVLVKDATTVRFQLHMFDALSIVNTEGDRVLYNGLHEIFVTNGVERFFSLEIDTSRDSVSTPTDLRFATQQFLR